MRHGYPPSDANQEFTSHGVIIIIIIIIINIITVVFLVMGGLTRKQVRIRMEYFIWKTHS